ncbi:flagellar biosynthetic protein FliO [Phreatobacter sp.]|uniref:flagellar biosynthetic protein FliO n=1 Tax=Phreatobacter sp. TaxID=1966341 RepID=UPI003F6F83A4
MAATFIVAFAVVLVLIGLTAWIFRLIRGRGLGIGSGGRGRQPRLAVLDYADVDQRRKLVLIRRDNVEHLLLLGGPTDVVVESAIVRGMPVPASALREPAAAEPAPPAPVAAEAPRLSMREQARQAAGEYAPRPEPAPAPRLDPVRPSLREPARPEPSRPEPARPAPVAPRETPRISPVVTPARAGQPAAPIAPPAAPRPGTGPAAAPATDDVAARLEAALRKPIGANPAAPLRPTPGMPAQPARPPAAKPGGPSAPAAAAAGSAGPAAAGGPAKPLSADDKSVFDSLEEEMAALLGRGPTPPKAS